MHRNGEGAIQDSGESIQDHSNCLQLCLFTNLREVDGSLTKATQLNIWRQPPPMGLLCLFASCCNMTYSVEMLLCLLKSVFKRSRSSQTVRSWLPLAHVHRDFTLQKETLHHPTPSIKHSPANHFQHCPPPPATSVVHVHRAQLRCEGTVNFSGFKLKV